MLPRIVDKGTVRILQGVARCWCSSSAQGGGRYTIPEEVRSRLTNQLKAFFPKKLPEIERRDLKNRRMKWRRKGILRQSLSPRLEESEVDAKYPVKELDMRHLGEDGASASSLGRVVRHKQLLKALHKRKATAHVRKQLEKASRYHAPKENKLPKQRGRTRMRYWEAKQLHSKGDALLDYQLKRTLPLKHMDDEDRVKLWGRPPAALEAKDEMDTECLAFFLRSLLDKPRKPWETGNNPYDKDRLRTLLDRKVQLDRIQGRLAEIDQSGGDVRLAPEYNYLRLRGRHLFHKYLDDLAELKKDLLAGLIEEADEEWKSFERYERKRIEGVLKRHALEERDVGATEATEQQEQEQQEQQEEQGKEPGGRRQETEAPPKSGARDALSPSSSSLTKTTRALRRATRMRLQEARFKERMELREVKEYLTKLREKEQDHQAAQVDRATVEDEPPLIWGTLPPTEAMLEYQAHVSRSSDFRGWHWDRPVYYVPRIPWRERRAAKEGQWPYRVDEFELPLDWEENYVHFPYYKRQQLWEDPALDSPTPSTEPDWPHRDEEFLDIYVSKHEFVHPGDWEVKLGHRKPSRYRTLKGTIFEEWFRMSPYENENFRAFMENPTSVPQHRLGMDLLGF